MKVSKTKQIKRCYNCKYRYNSSTRKYCPNTYKDGYNPCSKFKFDSFCKSFNFKRESKYE